MKTDCFPTCVAMVSGLSHDEALKVVHPFHIGGTGHATSSRDGIKALRTLGYRVRIRNVEPGFDFTSSRVVSIIRIRWRKGCYHAVVWDPSSQRILDPARGRARPKSFYRKNVVRILELRPSRKNK